VDLKIVMRHAPDRRPGTAGDVGEVERHLV
jgi:hypothetical protein